jgi:hypothetical protein
MNKEFIRMQQLAGLITESQYKQLLEDMEVVDRILDKIILRDSIIDIKTLPIVNRKIGFISPLGHWLRSNPDLVFQSIQYLNQNTDFNKNELKKIMFSFRENNYQDFKLIWSLIVLSSWLRYSGDNIKVTDG